MSNSCGVDRLDLHRLQTASVDFAVWTGHTLLRFHPCLHALQSTSGLEVDTFCSRVRPAVLRLVLDFCDCFLTGSTLTMTFMKSWICSPFYVFTSGCVTAVQKSTFLPTLTSELFRLGRFLGTSMASPTSVLCVSL